MDITLWYEFPLLGIIITLMCCAGVICAAVTRQISIMILIAIGGVSALLIAEATTTWHYEAGTHLPRVNKTYTVLAGPLAPSEKYSGEKLDKSIFLVLEDEKGNVGMWETSPEIINEEPCGRGRSELTIVKKRNSTRVTLTPTCSLPIPSPPPQ